MRDPVTISTGITYDRDCIEKWLFTFKNFTCPVTKQLLIVNSSSCRSSNSSDDLSLMIIPNHTLRRLIQSWCTLHASDGVDRIPTPKQPSILTLSNISKLISNAKKSTQMRYTCLQKIRSFLSQSTSKMILESSGVFEYLASVLVEDDATRSEKDEALSIVAQMDGYDQEQRQKLIKIMIFNNGDDDGGNLLIHSLIRLLRSGSHSPSHQERENVMKVLRLVYSVADPTQMSNVKCGMFDEIVSIIRDRNSNQGIKNGLKLLIELNPWGRNRVKAVGSGAVQVVVELLLDDGDRRISELGLVVLDQLCGCAEGRADLVQHSAGLAVVSKKILRVSHIGSDRAVRVLSLVSRYVGTGKVVGEMMEVGVVAKLCLVMQVECSLKTKERAKEMLRLHSRVWKNSPCIPPHLISSYPSN
ncbi:E3 ubiquitin-protein ligase PUB23 [Bienertia sinuspersici]